MRQFRVEYDPLHLLKILMTLQHILPGIFDRRKNDANQAKGECEDVHGLTCHGGGQHLQFFRVGIKVRGRFVVFDFILTVTRFITVDGHQRFGQVQKELIRFEFEIRNKMEILGEFVGCSVLAIVDKQQDDVLFVVLRRDDELTKHVRNECFGMI